MSKRKSEATKFGDTRTALENSCVAHQHSDSTARTLGKVLTSIYKKMKGSLPDSILTAAFLNTYGFDGYDPVTHQCSTRSEGVTDFEPEKLSAEC